MSSSELRRLPARAVAGAGRHVGQVVVRNLSLRTKMTVGIGVILALLIAAYALVAVSLQRRHLTRMMTSETDLVVAVADRMVTRLMEEGKGADVHTVLKRIGDEPQLARIRILDRTGVILRSTLPGEVGQRARGATEMPAGDRTTIVLDSASQRVRAFRAILNRPACYGCHSSTERVLGVLAVSSSLRPVDADMKRQWTILIAAGILGLIAAGLLIRMFFTILVGRRLDMLAATMSQVQAGDVSVRAPAGQHDELARLGESFNAMVARLADARRQLETRYEDEIRRAEHLAALGKMAAGVAHEINNPLAGMQNCVRTLLKGTRDDVQRVQYLGMLREGLDRIARIVSHMLTFAREPKPQLAPTDLVPLLHRCLLLVEHEVAAHHIGVTLVPADHLPKVFADAHQIEQLFLNILMNAVEAMPEGGRLTVRPTVGRRNGMSTVEVQVEDTGLGIAPEHMARIFDPFFTTKEVGKGTGLGLSVSYGIVKAHGGFISVSSVAGTGSTFTVVLPCELNGEEHAGARPAG